MYKLTRIAPSPREHFARTVDDEFAKFELKERAFRQADREERAAKLGLPLALSADSSFEGDLIVSTKRSARTLG